MPLSPLFLPEGMLLSCSTCLNPTPPSPIRLYQSLTPFSQPPKVKNSQPLQNSCWSARAKSVSNPKQGPSSSLGAALPFSTAQRHYFLDCVNVVAQPYFQLGLTRREVFLKAKGSSWQIGQHFSAGMYTYACLLCLFPQVTLFTSLIFFFFGLYNTEILPQFPDSQHQYFSVSSTTIHFWSACLCLYSSLANFYFNLFFH